MVKKIIGLFFCAALFAACEPCPDGETFFKATFPSENEEMFLSVPAKITATSGNGMSEIFNTSTANAELNVEDDGDECIETKGKVRSVTYQSEFYNYQLTLSLQHEEQKLMLRFSDALQPGYYYSSKNLMYEKNLLNANDEGTYKKSDGWYWGPSVSSPLVFHQTFLSNGKSYNQVYELPLYQNPEKNLLNINRVWVSNKEGIIQFSTTAGVTWYLPAK